MPKAVRWQHTYCCPDFLYSVYVPVCCPPSVPTSLGPQPTPSMAGFQKDLRARVRVPEGAG